MTCVVIGADEGELRGRLERLAADHGADAGRLAAEPPPSWIVGTIQQAAEQLGALRDAGVSRVMCQHLLHDDIEAVALLGRELAPLVR
jgi:alkanesulfonate monooxygenase SsuD/methylene tetrahydromethanopterin reductase-like flavin-dependent oxidoreductase (luciferase family)